MKTSDFDYNLPKCFIANNPVVPRDNSKLLVYDTKNDRILHKHFFELGEFLREGDTIVINRSKVIPARILFSNNGRQYEIFLLKKVEKNLWQVLVRPGKYFKEGAIFELPHQVEACVKKIMDDGTRLIEFTVNDTEADFLDILEKIGHTPLPPYIKGSKADTSQYQTVYAQEKGSVAAPTAGLHFTENLITGLKKEKINFAEVILHVGQGTFAPVKTESIEDHVMHEEFFSIDEKNATILEKSYNGIGRIFAVGTTSVRVLESVFTKHGKLPVTSDTTDIFIYPGHYKWKVVDSLITNFHLPKSTLIMLVASFLENKKVKNPVKKILELYEIAKNENYRFYSFGDAMLIL